jgi:hypothetical protein
MHKGRLEMAREYGRKAFKAGKKRVPALDNNLPRFMKYDNAKYAVALLKEWFTGWDEMNMAD